MTSEPTFTCSLCGDAFIGMGHNPEPLKRYEQRCCGACNALRVIPARMRRLGLMLDMRQPVEGDQ